jgi:hypothetical protein
MGKKKIPTKNAFAAALRKLKAEAQKRGLTLPEQISIYAGKRQNKIARLGQAESPIPPQILRQIIYATAEKAKLTPGQHLKSVLHPGVKGDVPKELQNWYAQIYGEFSKGGLSEVMGEVLLYGANRDDRLILRVRAAILSGDIRYLNQITRCVALVHGIKHESNGHAARLASLTQRNIGLAYLRLYELENKPPTAREIHVLLARDACFKNTGRLPRFTDIWYLLRSGPIDDSQNKPSRKARYELTGTKNIKKVVKFFRWRLGRTQDGPMSLDAVRKILDKAQLKYVDDSEAVSAN